MTAARIEANRKLMEDMLAAFRAGDMAAFAANLAPDIVWVMPGKGLLAGEHRGPDGVVQFLGKVMQLTNGTLTVNPTAISTDDEGAAFFTNDAAERNGRRLEADLVLRVDIRDGKWARVAEYIHDLYTWDEFWS